MGRALLKILIPIKRVADYRVKVAPDRFGTGVDLSNVKMSMNPFDEIAVEEAVRLKEKGFVSEVVAVTCGPASWEHTLRDALAMGADKAIHIVTVEPLSALPVAKLLKAVCDKEKPDLILCGKQANDDNAHQTGLMLAAILDWPQADCASSIALTAKAVEVTCEIDGGTETMELAIPALITVDLRLNEPRHIALANVMRAKRAPIETFTTDQFDIPLTTRLETVKVANPPSRFASGPIALPPFPWIWERPKRAETVMVKSVEELIQRLRDEAKII
jgi:electron transfer flavoprotein beta subunit